MPSVPELALEANALSPKPNSLGISLSLNQVFGSPNLLNQTGDVPHWTLTLSKEWAHPTPSPSLMAQNSPFLQHRTFRSLPYHFSRFECLIQKHGKLRTLVQCNLVWTRANVQEICCVSDAFWLFLTAIPRMNGKSMAQHAQPEQNSESLRALLSQASGQHVTNWCQPTVGSNFPFKKGLSSWGTSNNPDPPPHHLVDVRFALLLCRACWTSVWNQLHQFAWGMPHY